MYINYINLYLQKWPTALGCKSLSYGCIKPKAYSNINYAPNIVLKSTDAVVLLSPISGIVLLLTTFIPEVVTGKDLFTSVWANGQVIYAPNEYAFAVVELTNVPADTVFTEVKPAYVSETGETTYGGSFSYSLIAED